jgi:hypothetical protein
MFSKLFILLTSFVHHDTPVVQQHRVITVTVPEDEIIIETVRPEMASMYY